MARRDVALLREIEEAAHDESRSLAGALRKCVSLGAYAGSPELRDWAAEELDGYDTAGELPAYRKARALLLIDWVSPTGQMKGHQISVGELPAVARETGLNETVSLSYGVGQLEAMARPGDAVIISPPGAAEIVRLINLYGDARQVIRIYWAVDTSILEGALHRIRNTLVRLVAEIRAGMPDDEDVPSPEVATQALNVAVHGKKARVNVTSAQSVVGSSTASLSSDENAQDGGWSLWRKIGAVVVGLATVAGAVLAFIELT